MIVPPVERWIAGETVDAVTMDERINQVLEFLLEPPQAFARQTSAQSITSGNWTKILLDTTDKDNDGIVDLTNDKFVIQTPGWYEVVNGTSYATGSTVGRRITAFRLNGDASTTGGHRNRRDVVPRTGTGSSCRTGGAFGAIFLNKGDYIELMGIQDSGGSVNTYVSSDGQSFLAVRWVSN